MHTTGVLYPLLCGKLTEEITIWIQTTNSASPSSVTVCYPYLIPSFILQSRLTCSSTASCPVSFSKASDVGRKHRPSHRVSLTIGPVIRNKCFQVDKYICLQCSCMVEYWFVCCVNGALRPSREFFTFTPTFSTHGSALSSDGYLACLNYQDKGHPFLTPSSRTRHILNCYILLVLTTWVRCNRDVNTRPSACETNDLST